MGLGMQIVYLGFAGSAAIEAEAGVQLLRLERYCGVLAACHLAVELLHPGGLHPAYDVRLDLLSLLDGLKTLCRGTGDDPVVALREAFDAAEHELEMAIASSRVAGNRRARLDP